MSGFESLDPAIQHHIVNTLGWPGLRPLQEESIPAIVGGGDALLLAPTAGGKTEAAVFPVLTRMQEHRWAGTSVLYVCPLKALLNNLGPRLADYAAWVGRSASVWHGDVSQAARRGITRDRPDILLTTPESLESMLVSESVDAQQFLGDVRTVIVDEVHAFAGDDRGWHLLAVLARLESLISDASGPNAPAGGCSGSGCRLPSVTLTNCCDGSAEGRQTVGEWWHRRRRPRWVLRSPSMPSQRRERCHGHRGTTSWRETARVCRFTSVGRGTRDGTAKPRHHHVHLAFVIIGAAAPRIRSGLCRGPRLRHRRDVNAGTRDRRR